MTMDVRAVLLFSSIIPVIIGLMMAFYGYTRKSYPGFGFWVGASFCIGLGYILVALRNQIPDLFSIVASNALILYALVLTYDGFQLFFARRAFNFWNHLIFGMGLLLQIYLTYIRPDVNLRIVLVMSVAFILQFRVGVTLLRQAPPQFRRVCNSTALIFFISCLFALFRIVYTAVQTQPVNILLDQTLAVLSFASVCAQIIWTYFYFFLNIARLELELQETQQNLLSIAEADHHKVVQLSLLEETSRFLVESLDEDEIMQRMLGSVVQKFGYAEAAISLLVDGNFLEVIAIDGTENIGYTRGYRQKVGEGIIGYAGQKKQSYVSGDIEHDPYYYSIGKRSGSAMGVPMLNEGQLMGVLYVESAMRNAFNQIDITTLETLVSYAVTAIQKARLYTRVQTQLLGITTLQSVSHAILASLDLQQIIQSVITILKDTFKYTYISIYILQDQVLHLAAQVGYPAEMIINEIPAVSGITGRCVQQKQIQFIQDVTRDPAFLQAAYGIESEICVPLLKEDTVLGVINVESVPGHQLAENDVALLAALAGPVVIAIENARLHARVKELAMIDGLTNLYNRRAFDQALESEFERATRYHYPLALLFIDLDFFKQFNDRWGHLAGDERLKTVAELLKSDLRHPDLAARYGGDEFALLLPYSNKSGAILAAERLKALVQTFTFEKSDRDAEDLGCTISVGVAVFPDDAKTASELLHAADQAELVAKKQGKNRVCAAGEC